MSKVDIFSLGYTQEDLDKIKSTYYVGNYSIDVLHSKILEVYKFLLNMGYSHNDVINITRGFLGIFVYDGEILRERISDLVFLGFNRETVKKMVKMSPKILSLSEACIEQKILDLMKLGYSRDDVIKMSAKSSGILMRSVDTIKQKINDIQKMGYQYKEVIKMAKNSPNIFCYSVDYLKQKISELELLGFSHDDVIAISIKFPSILSYSIDNIKQKIDDMVSLGYSRETVINMIKDLPSLCGLSIDKIREKKDFYDSVGLSEIMIKKTSMIMQSVDLCYARYMFYKSIGIDITMDNYLLLFCNQEKFKKKYGINNKDLIEMFGNVGECKKKINEKQ